MRIALCKSRFAGPVSGADETLVTYARYLHRAGHDVQVVTLYPFSSRDPYYRRLAAEGIPVRSIVEKAWLFSMLQAARQLATHVLFVFVLLYSFASHARGLWTAILHLVSAFYAPRCRRFFEANRFDIVHLVTPDAGTPVLIRACHAAGLPTLYQELGSPDHPEAHRHYRRLARAIPLCSSVVALSPKLAEEWSGRFPGVRQVGILPLLVAPPVRLDIPRRPAPFDVVFGFSGRLEALKGTLELLTGFARLGPGLARPYLRIAGEGPDVYKARRLSHGLGIADRCDYVGRYGEIEGRSAFFGSLDVLVLPTRTEGTPNSIIEAMASGVPVIASAVGGIPDIVTRDVGLLVPPGDIEALTAAMRRLARDPKRRAQMGAAARERYQQFFSPEAVLPVLLAQYDVARARHAGAGARDEEQGPVRDAPCWGLDRPVPSYVASV